MKPFPALSPTLSPAISSPISSPSWKVDPVGNPLGNPLEPGPSCWAARCRQRQFFTFPMPFIKAWSKLRCTAGLKRRRCGKRFGVGAIVKIWPKLRIAYTSMTLSIHLKYIFRMFMNIWWFNGPMDSMACFKGNRPCWNHGQILPPWGTLTSQLPARDLPPQLKRTWAWDRLAWRGSLVLCLTNTYIVGT